MCTAALADTLVWNRRRRRVSASVTVTHRIARRMEPALARNILYALDRTRAAINLGELESLLAAHAPVTSLIAQVPLSHMVVMERVLVDNVKIPPSFFAQLEDAIWKAMAAAGDANAEVLSSALDTIVGFNQMSPNVVLYARKRSAELVTRVTKDVRSAIRKVTVAGAEHGLTNGTQARLIRDLVGLPDNWLNAPMNLYNDLMVGDVSAATGRYLSGTAQQQIRSAIAKGPVTSSFAEEMMGLYADTLRNLRADGIARYESLAAATNGQHESWRQSLANGDLPDTARRFWEVTDDERLSEEHAAIPGMNPDGREIDEPFDTEDGAFMDPPIRPNCRCGVSLQFPGYDGVI